MHAKCLDGKEQFKRSGTPPKIPQHDIPGNIEVDHSLIKLAKQNISSVEQDNNSLQLLL